MNLSPLFGASSVPRNPLVVLAVAALFLLAPAPHPAFAQAAASSEAATHNQKGLDLAQSGNLPGGELEIRKAVELAPQNPQFLSNLGTILAMQKKFEESTSFFEKSLKIDPHAQQIRRYLAANLWQLHRFTEARIELEKLLKENPEDAQSQLLLGLVSEKLHSYPAAIRALSSVPDLVRQQPQAMAVLARCYYRVGKTEDARNWLAELQKHPSGAPAALLAAQVAQDMQDFATAESILKSISSSSADPAALSYHIASLQFDSHQYEECLQTLQHAAAAGHSTAEIQRLLGWTFFRLNRREESIHAFQEAVRLAPTEEANFLDLGKVLLLMKRLPQAQEFAQRGIGAFPNSAAFYRLKGNVEMAQGRFTEAKDSFSEALKLEPNSDDSIIGIAQAQAGGGNSMEAKITLQDAISSTSRNARLELALGEVFLKEAEAGDKTADTHAEEILKRAVSHDDTLAQGYLDLGSQALRKGQPAQAVTYLERAVKLDATVAQAHFALARAYRRLDREQDAARETALYEKWKPQESPAPPTSMQPPN